MFLIGLSTVEEMPSQTHCLAEKTGSLKDRLDFRIPSHALAVKWLSQDGTVSWLPMLPICTVSFLRQSQGVDYLRVGWFICLTFLKPAVDP